MNLNLNLNYTEKLFVLARKAIPYSVNAAKDIMTTGGGGGGGLFTHFSKMIVFHRFHCSPQ